MILLEKLKSSLENSQVIYYHPFDDSVILNQYIGSNISVSFTGKVQCVGCSQSVKKVIQGYCYLCSRRLACCDLCILKPSLCHFSEGTCREPDWGKKYCFQDHVLYLSLTSGLKVGLTRHSQFLTRWIDQGAIKGSILATVSSRKLAGIIELFLSEKISDKTNWRDLLTGKICHSDGFEDQFHILQSLIKGNSEFEQSDVSFHPYQPVSLEYPVLSYLEKAKTINLDKTPYFSDRLIGIKGQYLFFESLGGLNIRKYRGYDISMEIES